MCSVFLCVVKMTAIMTKRITIWIIWEKKKTNMGPNNEADF